MKNRLPHSPDVKVFLIDFDGTLVDSVPALFQCYKAFLAKYGAKGTKQEFRILAGPPLSEIVQFLKRKHHLTGSDQDLHKEYLSLITACYKEKVKLQPNAEETLRLLTGLGVRLAIVTSAPRSLVKKYLLSNQLDSLFEMIISAAEREQPKPDPAIYARALRKMKVSPGEALAIEDSPKGCSSATAAGLITIYLSDKGMKAAPLVKPCSSWKQVYDYFYKDMDKQ